MFLTGLGLRGTFIRSVAHDPDSAVDALAEQLGLRIALSMLAALVAIAACLVLGYSRTVVACTAVASLGIVLMTVSTTALDLLQAMHRLPTIAVVNMVAGVVLTGGSIVAVWRGAGPVGVALSYLLGPATSAILLLWIVQKDHFPVHVRWNARRCGRLLWDARFFAAQQFLATVSLNAESLIIPRMLGLTAFGFFSAGSLPATRLTAVPDGLCTAAYPAIAKAFRQSPGAATRLLARFLFLVLAVCVPMAATVSMLAGPIARLLFPGRAETCEQVIRISIWLLPLMGVVWLLGTGLNAMNRDAAQARASLIAATGSLVLSTLLIWRFGLIGACWAMVLRYIVYLFALIPHIRLLWQPSQSSFVRAQSAVATAEAIPVPS
jgi:O-antigen/teichoic acid export membrane protein